MYNGEHDLESNGLPCGVGICSRLMRRRALLMGAKERPPMIILVDTTKTGATPSTGFQIPANAPGETYSYKVDWGDGTKTEGHTGITSHTYLTGGIYQVKIYGKFPRFYFNNTGDRLKILKIQDWGEINYSTNQNFAFWGCNNLDYIAKDDINAWYNGIVSAIAMFQNNSLTSLPDNMTLANLTTGSNMFQNNSLTSLPDGMTLSSLTNGNAMFYTNSLTSLPDGMVLAKLTVGNTMFANNPLTILPDGMTLSSLTSGNYMFAGNSLASLPDGMTLSSLTNGNQMFYSNSLTSLPDGMTLGNLTDGTYMFRNNTINTVRYSQLLIDMEALNPNNNVTFHAGNSKYNSSAVTARATLTSAPRNWTITDGGLI